MTTKPTVYTYTPPRLARNEQSRWRVAFTTIFFADNTHATITLACAPTKSVSEEMLIETAELLLEGFRLTYPGLDTLQGGRMRFYKMAVVNGRGDILRDSDISLMALSLYERLHSLEYYAFYYAFNFLERLVVAYESIPAHTAPDVEAFASEVHALRSVYEKASRENRENHA